MGDYSSSTPKRGGLFQRMLKFEPQNKNVEAEIKSEILENMVLGAKRGLKGALWFKAVFSFISALFLKYVDKI